MADRILRLGEEDSRTFANWATGTQGRSRRPVKSPVVIISRPRISSRICKPCIEVAAGMTYTSFSVGSYLTTGLTKARRQRNTRSSLLLMLEMSIMAWWQTWDTDCRRFNCYETLTFRLLGWFAPVLPLSTVPLSLSITIFPAVLALLNVLPPTHISYALTTGGYPIFDNYATCFIGWRGSQERVLHSHGGFNMHSHIEHWNPHWKP